MLLSQLTLNLFQVTGMAQAATQISQQKQCGSHINQLSMHAKRLEKNITEHIENYGAGNDKRLTGLHETQSIDQFSYGVSDRGASIRIPWQVEVDQKGYLEDRRPASNMDPYLVTKLLIQTTCG